MSDSLFRISLKAYIENDKGEVLVAKEQGRTQWDMPGGGLEFGEDIKATLSREIEEEVGYTGDFTYAVIGVEEPHALLRGIWQVRAVFKVIPETFDFTAGKESDEVKFVDPNEFEESDSGAERLVCYYWRKLRGDNTYNPHMPESEVKRGM